MFLPRPASHDFSGWALAPSGGGEADGGAGGDAGSVSALAAAAAAGPWRWEQCSRDYATRWERQRAAQAPATRLAPRQPGRQAVCQPSHRSARRAMVAWATWTSLPSLGGPGSRPSLGSSRRLNRRTMLLSANNFLPG